MNTTLAKTPIKSAEQRMIEKATAEYVSKLQAIAGKDVKAIIQLEGFPFSKIAVITEFLDSQEDEPIEIKVSSLNQRSIFPSAMKGNGFDIDRISE